MTNAEKAAQAAAKTPVPFSVDALLKGTKAISMSNELIEGQFRGAKVKNAGIKDVERIQTGQVNSALRVDEVFRIVGIKIVEQEVQSSGKKELLLLIVENPVGDQRAIYASTLFRANPTASSAKNDYDSTVLDFDRGILQGTNGAGAPKMLEKLYGNGTDFIKVSAEMTFTTNATRQTEGNLALGETIGSDFVITQRVFRLEHISEADALATIAA